MAATKELLIGINGTAGQLGGEDGEILLGL